MRTNVLWISYLVDYCSRAQISYFSTHLFAKVFTIYKFPQIFEFGQETPCNTDLEQSSVIHPLRYTAECGI